MKRRLRLRGGLALALGVLASVAATGVAPPAAARCMLGQATRPDIELRPAPEAQFAPLWCPRSPRGAVGVPLDSLGSRNASGLRVCGRCDRRRTLVWVAGDTYYVRPKDVRIVERPGEIDDVPLRLPHTGRPCEEAAIRRRGAPIFFLDAARGPASLVRSVDLAPRGQVVGACAQYGGMLLVVHDGRPGLMLARDLMATGTERHVGFYAQEGPFCDKPTWGARTVRPTFVYELEREADGRVFAHAGEAAVPAGAAASVDWIARGRRTRRNWIMATIQGQTGMVPLDAIELEPGVAPARRTKPLGGCPSELPVQRTLETVELRSVRWRDATLQEPLPSPFAVPAGTEVPVLTAGPRMTRVLLGDLEAEVPTRTLGGPHRTLTLTRALPDSVEIHAGGRAFDQARWASLPQAFDDRWDEHVGRPARVLALRVARSRRPDALVQTAPEMFPIGDLSAASLALLAEEAPPLVLVAAAAGEEATVSPMLGKLRRLVARFAPERWTPAPPRATPRPPWVPDADAALRRGLPCLGAPCATPRASLGAATALHQLGLVVSAREAYLEVLERGATGTLGGAAMAGYRHASFDAGSSLRAAAVLGPRCEGSEGADVQACFLAATAALDSGQTARAGALLSHLAVAEPDARLLALSAARRAAAGELAPAASEMLRALEAGLSECGPGSELVERLTVQLVRLAHETAEYELAYEASRYLAPATAEAYPHEVLQALLMTERYDEAHALLAGRPSGPLEVDLELALWRVAVFDRSCLTQHAFDARALFDAEHARVTAGIAALRSALRDGPTARWLLPALDEAFRSRRLGTAAFRELDAALGCEAPCATWTRIGDELRALDAYARRAGVPVSGPTQRTLIGLREQSDALCVGAVLGALEQLERARDDLVDKRELLDVDRDDQAEHELRLLVQVSELLLRTSRERRHQANPTGLPCAQLASLAAAPVAAPSLATVEGAARCPGVPSRSPVCEPGIDGASTRSAGAELDRAIVTTLACVVGAARSLPPGPARARAEVRPPAPDRLGAGRHPDPLAAGLARFQPILGLVRQRHLRQVSLDGVPAGLVARLRAQAAANGAHASRCLADRGELVSMLAQ